MIVIAMTSWTKRINNVLPVVRNILYNTILVDRLYLTLATEEFPNKENDLPKDLVELFNSNERLIINWVDKNTKSMKKVFPVLKYLNDDDIIIDMDDDFYIPNDFVKCRLEEFCRYNMKYPITGYNAPKKASFRCGLVYFHNMSPTSIFQKKMFKNWELVLTDELIETYNDDFVYTLIFLMNGYKPKATQVLSTHVGIGPRKLLCVNEFEGMSHNKVYKKDRIVFNKFEIIYRNVFNKDFKAFLNEKYGGDIC